MIELQVPSNKRSPIGFTDEVKMLFSLTNDALIKQCEDPESIRVLEGRVIGERYRVIKRDSGLERADAFSRTKLATRIKSTQSSDRVAYP